MQLQRYGRFNGTTKKQTQQLTTPVEFSTNGFFRNLKLLLKRPTARCKTNAGSRLLWRLLHAFLPSVRIASISATSQFKPLRKRLSAAYRLRRRLVAVNVGGWGQELMHMRVRKALQSALMCFTCVTLSHAMHRTVCVISVRDWWTGYE